MFCLNNRDQNNVTNGNSNSNGFTWVSTWDTTNTFHVTAENSAVNRQEGGLANALMFVPHNAVGGRQYRSNYAEAYGGRDLSNSHVQLDPHLTCLKLGKRHYFEDASGGGGGGGLVVSDKRGKGGYCSGGKTSAALGVGSSVARCQVEGCHVALMNAKEYHKRHKVCEMHSKAPKVVVLGLEQRFCQQCSRLVMSYSIVILDKYIFAFSLSLFIVFIFIDIILTQQLCFLFVGVILLYSTLVYKTKIKLSFCSLFFSMFSL